MQGDKGFDGGFGVLRCAAAGALPVGGCLGLHSDYLQTLLGDRELLFTAHRLSITCIWLKIYYRAGAEQERGGSRSDGKHCLQGNRSHTTVKWYQGKELFLWPAVPSFTKRAQMAGMHVHAEHLAAALLRVKVPFIEGEGMCSQWTQHFSTSSSFVPEMRPVVKTSLSHEIKYIIKYLKRGNVSSFLCLEKVVTNKWLNETTKPHHGKNKSAFSLAMLT